MSYEDKGTLWECNTKENHINQENRKIKKLYKCYLRKCICKGRGVMGSCQYCGIVFHNCPLCKKAIQLNYYNNTIVNSYIVKKHLIRKHDMKFKKKI